jgi:ribosomal protein S21
MGHITVVNNEIEEALKIGKNIKKIVKVTAWKWSKLE